ncbi:MAG: hypothetical protein L3K08_07540 [Thermoplasmata archaeon]|nr:hypothetical protein [Thermoplasmata archaeon]
MLGIAVAALALMVPALGASASATSNLSNVGRITVQSTETILNSGCHHLLAPLPRFHRASDLVTWQAAAAASDCTKVFQGPGLTDGASEAVSVALTLPVRTLPGNAVNTTVQLQWNISATGNISTKITGRCPTALLNATTGDGSQFCEIAAYAGFQVDAYLYDTTNGSSIYGTASPGLLQVYSDTTNSTYCYDFFCTSSNSTLSTPAPVLQTPFTDRIDLVGLLDHRHHYVVVTTLTAFVETLVTGYATHARATAVLDLRNGGLGANIGGLSVS